MLNTFTLTLFPTDIIGYILFVFLFLCAMSLQPIIFKEDYSTIYEVVYYQDTQNVFKTSAYRILVVIFLSILCSHFMSHSYKISILSCATGSFLQIWPAIISYKIFSFKINFQKLKYLFACILYIIFCIISVIMTYKVIIPLLNGFQDSFFLIENSGIQILGDLIAYAFAWKISIRFANPGIEKHFIDVQDFRQEVAIILRKMDIEDSYISLYQNEIQQYSQQYNLNPNLLKSILLLEYINRGSTFISVCEKIVCYIFPRWAIKKDLSVGLGQIKISTASKILKECPIYFLRKLFDPKFNIQVCSQYLNSLQTEYEDYANGCPPQPYDTSVMDCYEYVACHYLGFSVLSNHKNVELYATIMRSYSESNT